jgi:serine/threonine protein kinase
MSSSRGRLQAFDFEPGAILVNKYRVIEKLGGGWEGEVYRIREMMTGVDRAAKFFYPQRNVRDHAVKFYARKLHKLRHCPILIQYITQEHTFIEDEPVTFLVSEYAEGQSLHDFLADQPGKRLTPFEALHLLHALASGMAMVHAARECHGDLHTGNVLVRRRGLGFDLKLVDFYRLHGLKPEQIQDDVLGLVQILHACVGGARYYARQPPEIKQVVRGLKGSLVRQRFRTAKHVRDYLEDLTWDGASAGRNPPRRAGGR